MVDEEVIREITLMSVELEPLAAKEVKLPPAEPAVVSPGIPGTTLTDFLDTPSDLLPTVGKFIRPPFAKSDKKALVIDIETTGLKPWEGKIFAIGVLDPQKAIEGVTVFVDDDEEQLMKDFINFYQTNGYNELIGFNVSFDLRWMFAVAMKYRQTAAELFNANLRDVSQVLKQVQEAFVYGFNRPGTLDEWSFYLLGVEKIVPYGPDPTPEELEIKKKWNKTELTHKRLNEAFEKRDWETITGYNARDVEITYSLWSLTELAKGRAEMTVINPGNPVELTNPGELVEKRCPVCGQVQYVKAGTTTIFCEVCEKDVNV